MDDDFFWKMIYEERPQDDINEPKCPRCGMTYSEFNRLGYFGCPDCYVAFAEKIRPLMERIHGAGKHIGKVPNRGCGVFRTVNQIKRLRQRLQHLVREERYEEAAKIRDEIRALERGSRHDQ